MPLSVSPSLRRGRRHHHRLRHDAREAVGGSGQSARGSYGQGGEEQVGRRGICLYTSCIYKYRYIYTYIYVYAYIYMCVCVCVCMCVCVGLNSGLKLGLGLPRSSFCTRIFPWGAAAFHEEEERKRIVLKSFWVLLGVMSSSVGILSLGETLGPCRWGQRPLPVSWSVAKGPRP
jgi:hypothetical protein